MGNHACSFPELCHYSAKVCQEKNGSSQIWVDPAVNTDVKWD